MFSNKSYDIWKSIAQIWLPALGTFYFALSGIWGLPYAEKIIGTITAVDTFLGVILHLSARAYKPGIDGRLVVDDTDPDGPTMANFDLITKPPDIIAKKQVVFDVVHKDATSPPPPLQVLPPSA